MNPWLPTILILHAAATWYLVGLVWVIQRIHYPSMRLVDLGRFPEFERQHCRRMGPLVAPAMIAEGGAACTLLGLSDGGINAGLAWAGVALLLVVWGSTFWVQVPLHDRLQTGFDLATIDRLVKTNWIRTVAWSLRGAIALLLLQRIA